VHLDLNFTNILVREGRLTGIVDLDHLGGGDDRSVDLATLVFNFEEDRQQFGRAPPAGAVERLQHAVHQISGEAGWRQAVSFRAISDLAWIGLDGQRLPLSGTLAVIRAVVPELDGRTPR
jgi:aminoglycoside phosphotransferase (APT) family kinase protein